MSQALATQAQTTWIDRIERIGNKLPDPVTLFIYLWGIVFVLSFVLSQAGISVIHPTSKELIVAKSLLTTESLQLFISKIVATFQGFAPLGLVLVVIIGAGLAEKTGYIPALIHCYLAKTPASLLTFTVILVGLSSNMAADAGFIVLPPLAALLYLGMGRNPLLGIFVAYGSVAAGFSANLLVNLIDVLLFGFTEPAARSIDPNYQGTPAMNWYFCAISTVVLAIVATWVTEKIVAKRLPADVSSTTPEEGLQKVDENIQRAVKKANLALLAYVVFIVLLCFFPLGHAFLADKDSNSLITGKPLLMNGMIPIMTLAFFIPAYVYGKCSGSIKNDKDAARLMGESLSEMGPYILLAFVSAQFLFLFGESKLGTILAISGANFLKSIGFVGAPLLVGLLILSAFINLFVGSASAKWAILAPIFVPMFMLLNIEPAYVQMAYRIGDSVTNPISPLFPYFPIMIGFVRKYKPDAGIGTIIANMLPYSISFAVAWIPLLVLFYVLGWPLGPTQ